MWMLHCAQHDKSESMDASLRLRCVQHDNSDSVIPHTSEESTQWMLHFAQQDKARSKQKGECHTRPQLLHP